MEDLEELNEGSDAELHLVASATAECVHSTRFLSVQRVRRVRMIVEGRTMTRADGQRQAVDASYGTLDFLSPK